MIGLFLQTVSVSLQLVNVGNHSEVSLCIHATAALFLRFCIFHSFIGILCRSSVFLPLEHVLLAVSCFSLSCGQAMKQSSCLPFLYPSSSPSLYPTSVYLIPIFTYCCCFADTSSTALPQSIVNSLNSFIYSRKIHIGIIE